MPGDGVVTVGLMGQDYAGRGMPHWLQSKTLRFTGSCSLLCESSCQRCEHVVCSRGGLWGGAVARQAS